MAALVKKLMQSKLLTEEPLVKTAILSNMSHEIRTQMRLLIQCHFKTELNKSQKNISAIQESGDALIILINDILDIAKVDAGMMSFEKTALSKSISATLHLLNKRCLKKNFIALSHNHDPAIPKILIETMRLRQMNLMSNAIKVQKEK
jgi:signal transduction histidine kinase